ncbi:15-hydroxyprostaglandin dehydrogenase [NAD(+)]-like [Ptychodera flava]|uniref:15-hydroxyprostaglandin dehydrogenase [NAD(+)]-like n=1 Tax=Ptychodera flava TaxID=63121 RepID=UPI003969F03A
MDIKDKVALVTGAAVSRSIGLAVVEKLLEKGAKGVSVIDINSEKGEETVEELNKKYGKDKVIFIDCDVGSKSQLEAAYKKTKDTFGQIDIVSNNAGIVNEQEYEKMIGVNLGGVVHSTLLAVEFMGTKNGGNGGVVINTASFAGIFPNNLLPVYAATKHGVVGYTRSVANEPRVLENDVRVAAICPGMVNTATALKTYPSEANRYVKELKEDMERAPAIEPEVVGDSVVKMIEDPNYSGTASLIGGGVPLTTVEIPFIDPV